MDGDQRPNPGPQKKQQLLIIARDGARQRQLLARVETAGGRATAVSALPSPPPYPRDQRPPLLLVDAPLFDDNGREQLQRLMLTSPHPHYVIGCLDEARETPVGEQTLEALDDLVLSDDPLELVVRLRLADRVQALAEELEALRERPAPPPPATDARTATLDEGPVPRLRDALHRTHALATRHGMPYGVLVARIDGWEAYLGTAGEGAATRGRAMVDATLRRAVRSGDEVYSQEPERWVCVCAALNAFGLVAMAERLQSRIRSLQIEHPGAESRRLSMSVGAAAFAPRQPDARALKWQAVLERAEEALAKLEAGGRFALWSPPR